MSAVYNLEPPTQGKVILKTSHGDIDIELWPKEAPKAVRNFVQLCMEGYYDDTVFHRIVPGLAIQGGDPTGTGTGGDSIYGAPFRDEFHSRLRFSHRGVVACANPNIRDANGSQFFITLDKAEGFNKKHTIFGKVTGDTIFNVVHIGECEVDEEDRPLAPPVLHSVDVLWNPFDDIVPRTTPEERKRKKEAAVAAAKKKERDARPKKKNTTLLSFGEEAEQEEEELAAAPVRKGVLSAHDAVEDQRLAKEHAVDLAAYANVPRRRAKQQQEQGGGRGAPQGRGEEEEEGEQEEEGGRDHEGAARARTALTKRKARPEDGGEEEGTAQERLRAKVMAARSRQGSDRPEPAAAAAVEERRRPSSKEGSSSGEEEEEEGGRGAGRPPSSSKREYMEERRKAVLEKSKAKAAVVAPSRQVRMVADEELLTDWQRKRREYKERRRAGGGREKDTMARLAAFTKALRGACDDEAAEKEEPQAQQGTGPKEGKGKQKEQQKDKDGGGGYDGRVRGDLDHDLLKPAAWRVDQYLREDEEGGEGEGKNKKGALDELRGHTLKFVKIKDQMSRRDNVDDYVVIDELAAKGKQFSRQGAAEKKRGTEWAGRAIA